MKVICIVGTRPNFVKIAPLLQEMEKFRRIEARLVHTGQHYDSEMSDSFFRDLQVKAPDYNLRVGSLDGISKTAEIMIRLEPILRHENPRAVVVVGDVESTLAGALTAAKLRIPIVHVESGLRSFDRTMPEEINRVVTDAISDLLFVSEPAGLVNLRREGIPADRTFLVGNIMIDTLKRCLRRPRKTSLLSELGLEVDHHRHRRRRYGVLTLHRQGLVDNLELFEQIWKALEDVATEIPIVFPVHPRTRKRLEEAGIKVRRYQEEDKGKRGVWVISPLPYSQFLYLQSAATVVLTDSGGIQEETTVLGVPCLTLRENTERPVTVTQGTNKIVGLDPEKIRAEVLRLLRNPQRKRRIPRLWDGRASKRIVRIMCQRL